MKEVIYNFLLSVSKVILFFKRLAVRRRMFKELLDCYDFSNDQFYLSQYLVEDVKSYYKENFELSCKIYNKINKSK